MDMREYANNLGAGMMKAQVSGPLPGYDYAAMPQPEKTGYAKALLDTIAYLDSQALAEANAIVAAGLHLGACELVVFRNLQINAASQGEPRNG